MKSIKGGTTNCWQYHHARRFFESKFSVEWGTVEQGSAKNVPAPWIWIKKIKSWKSTWPNMFCPGFETSQVDPIFSFWILIKSSWFNIFWTGFRFEKMIEIQREKNWINTTWYKSEGQNIGSNLVDLESKNAEPCHRIQESKKWTTSVVKTQVWNQKFRYEKHLNFNYMKKMSSIIEPQLSLLIRSRSKNKLWGESPGNINECLGIGKGSGKGIG